MVFDLGYGLTALGYFLLFLLLLTTRKSGFARHLLMLSTIIMVAWAVLHVTYINNNLSRESILVYDSIRQSVWMLFICACIQTSVSNLFSFLRQPTTLIALILPVTTMLSAGFQLMPSSWQFSLHTLLAIQALVMTEIMYRQAGENKWAFKPLVIYLAAINLMDFAIYANALMLNTLSWDFFAARGYIFFTLMPFLVIAVRRIKHWGIEIFVSRDVVLHSTLLLLAGIYLLVMSLLGYLVKYYGGSWSLSIQLALVVISLTLLAALLMSHQIRTKVKVFITKHFYANQYDYRVEWVKLTKTLTESKTDNLPSVYETALRGWMEGIGYDSGIVYKKRNLDFTPVSRLPAHAEDLPRLVIQCIARFYDTKPWIIDVDELKSKPENYAHLDEKSAFIHHCPYQLIIPIVVNDDLWGFVCLDAELPNRRALNWELRDYISALSDQITSFIINAENSLALAENAQFAAFNRMSAFVVHDLKNVLAQINLIISNAKEHKDNPEFIEDTFETLEYTKERMDKMLKQLMQKNTEPNKGKNNVEVVSLINDLIAQKCATLLPLPKVDANGEINLQIDAEKLSNVLYHLIQNAQQATPDDGSVNLQISQTDAEVEIQIADNGEGMSMDFIKHRLFKPFDTTKGNAGMGIGAYDAKTFIEESKGILEVESEVGQGTTFLIKLPKGL
ncbi:XrtA/PEP-CTERM system histidine kinase PrsK [Glaciecola sp. 1036]|uniref:XrtA/PEP-CTERM system histidine kinase PrsK n=1 Tax=Alteromonadaceae TaxID=72275 RepID=UPI003D003340